MIRIEPLTERTLAGIVACERADTKQWFWYHSMTEKEETTYERLSPEQRWFHGGPTMDLTLFSRYWSESRQKRFDRFEFFVALEGEKVVGYIAFLIGRESVIPGKHAYIDLLLVHPEERRKGIATRLVQKVESVALETGCQSLYVYPEEMNGPSGKFYEQLGFTVWQERFRVPVDTVANPSLEPFLKPAPQIRKENWRFLFGWHSTSPKAWLMLHSNFERGLFEVKRPLFVYKEEGLPEVILGTIRWSNLFTTGPAYLWLLSSQETFTAQTVKKYVSALSHLGFTVGLEKVNLIFLEELFPLIKQLSLDGPAVKMEPLLIKQLPSR